MGLTGVFIASVVTLWLMSLQPGTVTVIRAQTSWRSPSMARRSLCPSFIQLAYSRAQGSGSQAPPPDPTIREAFWNITIPCLLPCHIKQVSCGQMWVMCGRMDQDVRVGAEQAPPSCRIGIEGIYGERLWRLKPQVSGAKVREMSFTSWDSWWKDQSP